MAKLYLLSLLLLAASNCMCDNLQVGSSINSSVAYIEEVKLNSIPLTQRTKNVFYADERNPNILIKGISAIDILNSSTKPIVTAGGVGSYFVNLRLKSPRGQGLHYQVQVFV